MQDTLRDPPQPPYPSQGYFAHLYPVALSLTILGASCATLYFGYHLVRATLDTGEGASPAPIALKRSAHAPGPGGQGALEVPPHGKAPRAPEMVRADGYVVEAKFLTAQESEDLNVSAEDGVVFLSDFPPTPSSAPTPNPSKGEGGGAIPTERRGEARAVRIVQFRQCLPPEVRKGQYLRVRGVDGGLTRTGVKTYFDCELVKD